jgi:hypothetical protein
MSKKIRNVEDQKKDFDKVLKEFEAQQEVKLYVQWKI